MSDLFMPQHLKKAPRAKTRLALKTKGEMVNPILLSSIPLALAACGGGDEIHLEPPEQGSDGANLLDKGITQKLAFDVSEIDLNSLQWLTPAAGGYFGESVKVDAGEPTFVVIPAMFDVEHGSSPNEPIAGNLIVFRESEGSFVQVGSVSVTGFAHHLFVLDLNGDGVQEVIGVPNGEDGRVIIDEVRDAHTKPFIYDVLGNEITYFGVAAWQHAYGFADINYDGINDLIVAPIGSDPAPVSRVYNLIDFSEIEIDHEFLGHAEGEIAFADIDGDGLVEFVETDDAWSAASGDGNLYLNIYEVSEGGVVSLQQQEKIGELDGEIYNLQSWNSDDVTGYPTGFAFGKEFNTLHRWHSEFIDIDSDGDRDLLMIYSIDNNQIQSRLDSIEAGVEYEAPIVIVTIDNESGSFDFNSLQLVEVNADFVGKGFTFADFDGDGYVDMYLDINLMPPNFEGSDLGDRFWLNDGNGKFSSAGAAADDSIYGKEFMSAGEYTVLEINDILTLVGFTSNLDGSDLSFISLPIAEII